MTKINKIARFYEQAAANQTRYETYKREYHESHQRKECAGVQPDSKGLETTLEPANRTNLPRWEDGRIIRDISLEYYDPGFLDAVLSMAKPKKK